MNKKRLIILDSHSLIHRAYHAIPFLKTKKGETVNAVYGFFSILIKGIQDFNPDYIAAVFDFPAPTFRHKKYKEYKIKRPKTPDDLIIQIPKIKEALNSLNISLFEKKGFEADDIIGTISSNLRKKDTESIIVSGDMDNLQLIDDKTKVYLLKRGIKEAYLFDIEKVNKTYNQLDPKQLVDYKSLKGDPSDNILGVPGIGEKTAMDLIVNFKSLENIYLELEKETKKSKKINPKTREKLTKFKKEAFLSKELVLIKKDVDIDFNLSDCHWNGFNEKEVDDAFKEFEFYSLIKRIKKNSSAGSNLTLF